MMYHNRKKSAFTLVEILISVSIVIFVILSASAIFRSILSGSDTIVSSSSSIDDIHYFLDLATKSISQAQEGDGVLCSIPSDKFFVQATSSLAFAVNGDCYSFDLVDDNGLNRVEMGVSYKGTQYISSRKVNISKLEFLVEDTIALGQPIVTILVSAHPVDDPSNILSLQTSVSIVKYD